MTLQSSGAISLSDIRAEYQGGSDAISMGNMYRGGSNVRGNSGDNPSTNLSANVPTSGAISFSNFYSQEKGYQYTEGTNRTNKSAQDYFGTDYAANYPKKLTISSTITNTNVNGVALTFPSGLSGSLAVTLTGTITSTTGYCLKNDSSVSVSITGSGTITRNSGDAFVSALQGDGSVQINYIGGFGGASGGDIRHSDYGNTGFDSKLTRSGNTFTLSWTYNENDYLDLGSGSRDITNMFPLDSNGNYDFSNTNDLTNSANVTSSGRDTRNIAVGRELRSGVMYYWFCSNNKDTSFELANDRYIQYGHTQISLTTGNSQRSSVLQSLSAQTSTGSFSISGPTIN